MAGARNPRTAVQEVPAGPVPPPPPPAGDRPHGPPAAPARRRRRGPLLVALLLALLLAGGGALWLSTRGDTGTSAEAPAPSSAPADDGQSPSPAQDTAAQETTAQETTAPETSDPEPTPSPSEEPPESDRSSDDPAEVVEETLDRYYDLLTDDPDAAYDLTGPYLRSVADRGYFRDFWEPWEKVDLQEVRNVQQPEDGVITATTEIELTGDDGNERTERHQLRLVRDDDGSWLVDLDLAA